MIKIDIDQKIAVITMDRPAQRNAMSNGLVQALLESFLKLDLDQNISAMVLTGSGSGFCAGSDLSGLALMNAAERQMFEADSGRMARLIGRLTKPVIAAVDGYAIGGGMTLATSCDIVVSQRSAKWTLAEVPIGLFPAWGIESVTDRVGRPVAKRLAWGIDTLTGEEALKLGLADFTVDASALPSALEIATKLSALPPLQSSFVKEYFLVTGATCNEKGDVVANDLFMQSTKTDFANDCFHRFRSKLLAKGSS